MIRMLLVGLAVFVGQSHAQAQMGFDSGRDEGGAALFA
jgi:hypothetical protein